MDCVTVGDWCPPLFQHLRPVVAHVVGRRVDQQAGEVVHLTPRQLLGEASAHGRPRIMPIQVKAIFGSRTWPDKADGCELGTGIVGWLDGLGVALAPNRPPHGAVQALHGIGGVDRPADRRREREEGNGNGSNV